MIKTYKSLALACLTTVSTMAVLSPSSAKAQAMQEVQLQRPALVITSEPLPENLESSLYSRPINSHAISGDQISGQAYYAPAQTLVSKEVAELNRESIALKSEIGRISDALNVLKQRNQDASADYYASLATINTQLQSGTTPGNPRLTRRLASAEAALEDLAVSTSNLNQLAVEAEEAASRAAYLVQSAQTAYTIPGAVEEDHDNLDLVQDKINTNVVGIERLLANISDDMTRLNAYLNTERQNIRTLALAVANGDLYGRSLSNVRFSSAPAGTTGIMQNTSYNAQMTPGYEPASPSPSAPRPLAKIRFDNPDVEYQEPVYAAVNEALQVYPQATFDVVAVHPTQGNAAQVAIESTRSRRNAQKVLRTLTEMGLDPMRVNLSYDESADIYANEVHIFVR